MSLSEDALDHRSLGAAQHRPAASWVSSLDLIVLVCLVVADVRVLSGSTVASFTLSELFIWGYCAPVAVAYCLVEGRSLPARCNRFLTPTALYMGWALIASVLALVFRSDSSVLQNAKNVLPAIVMVVFIFIRVRTVRQIALMCNLYTIYCILSCLLGLVQYRTGGPYLKELISGTEYKLDVAGNILDNPLVGFTGHPNNFAAAVLPGVVFVVMKLVAEMRNRWAVRPTTLLGAGLLLLSLVLSQARGEMIFTFAGIAFVLSPLGRTRSFLVKVGVMAALITAIMTYTLHVAQTTASPGSETVETRYLLWQTALDGMAFDGYILPFGNGTAYMTDHSLQTAGWEFSDSHNVWIDQVLYFGLPALILYLSIWWQFFRLVDGTFTRGPPLERTMMLSLRAVMIAFLGDFFFAAYANSVGSVTELFLMMALAVRLATLAPPAPQP